MEKIIPTIVDELGPDEISNFTGDGTYTFKDGSKYTGQWKNGVREGLGKIVYKDGKVFFGRFESNQRLEGQLIEKRNDGLLVKYIVLRTEVEERFIPNEEKTSENMLTNLRDEFRSAILSLVQATKDFDLKEFIKAVRTDIDREFPRVKVVTKTFPDGSIYNGEELRGVKHGVGIWSDGKATYAGEWKNGKRHGYGIELTGYIPQNYKPLEDLLKKEQFSIVELKKLLKDIQNNHSRKVRNKPKVSAKKLKWCLGGVIVTSAACNLDELGNSCSILVQTGYEVLKDEPDNLQLRGYQTTAQQLIYDSDNSLEELTTALISQTSISWAESTITNNESDNTIEKSNQKLSFSGIKDFFVQSTFTGSTVNSRPWNGKIIFKLECIGGEFGDYYETNANVNFGAIHPDSLSINRTYDGCTIDPYDYINWVKTGQIERDKGWLYETKEMAYKTWVKITRINFWETSNLTEEIDTIGYNLADELKKDDPDTLRLSNLVIEAEEVLAKVKTPEERQHAVIVEVFVEKAKKKAEKIVAEANTEVTVETIHLTIEEIANCEDENKLAELVKKADYQIKEANTDEEKHWARTLSLLKKAAERKLSK